MGAESRLDRAWGKAIAVALALVVCLIGAAAGAQAASAIPNLLGEWHLDAVTHPGDADITPDSSGNGNDLSVPGGPVVGEVISNGHFGGAFSFDGGGGGLPYITTSSLEPQHVTLMAWVRATESPGSYKYIAAEGGDAGCGNSSYALYSGANGGLQFYVRGPDGTPGISSDATSSIWDGNWHAVAGTYDGSVVRLYVDGQEVGTPQPGPAAIGYQADNTFELGNYPVDFSGQACEANHPFRYIGGTDEVRVYDDALTGEQINFLQTAAGSTPPELGVVPRVVTGQAANVTETTATLNGTVNPNGGPVLDCNFEYGTTLAYGSTVPCTPSPGSGNSDVAVTANLTRLSAGKAYNFRLVARNASGQQAGSNGTFATRAGPHAIFTMAGPSKTMPGGVWLNANPSIKGLPAGSLDFAWDTNGDGKYDWPCGHVPFVAFEFPHGGTHTIGLKVTDSRGAVSTFTQKIRFPAGLGHARIPTPTFDCENPASGGDTPNRADCVKSWGFGYVDATSKGKPEDCFQIQTTVSTKVLKFNPSSFATSAPDAQAAAADWIKFHATLNGPVAINGLYLSLSESSQTVYDSGDQYISLPRTQFQIGSFKTFTVNLGRVSTVPDKHGLVHVDDVALKAANAVLGALKIKDAITINLIYHASKTQFHLALPPPFTLGAHIGSEGASTNADVYLISDNQNGVKLDGVRLGPLDAFIGPLYVKRLTFKFLQSQNLWEGGADIFFPLSPVSLNAAQPPADAGFGIRNGHFDHAGVGLDFVVGAQPELFPSVFLTNIHVALGTRPLRFTGGGAISVGEVLSINGDVFVAFASPDQPYTFPTDEALGDLAPFAGQYLDSFSIALGGTASLDVPFFGQIGLANAHAIYEYPDYVELGADYGLDLGLIKFDGNLEGFMLPSAGKFSFTSSVSACPNFKVKLPIVGTVTIDKPCFGAGVAISTVGVGLCGVVPIPFFTGTVPVTITVGYKWGDGVGVSLFDCDLGPYTEANPRAAADHRARASAASSQFKLPGQAPSAMVKVTGQGGVPDVTLNGPNQTVIDTKNPPKSSNVVIMIQGDSTLIALKQPAGGTWTVTQDAGSVPVTGVAFAEGLPAPQIVASVSGRGLHRVLSYRVKQHPGLRVTFAEQGGRTFHLIGPAKNASGRISFTSANGRAGRRAIVALITENGTPARSIVVTHYSAPGPIRPARPGGLRISRTSVLVSVRWKPAAGAVRYQVILNGSNGERAVQLTSSSSAQFSVPDPAARVSVLVRGISAGGVIGPAVSASFRALKRH